MTSTRACPGTEPCFTRLRRVATTGSYARCPVWAPTSTREDGHGLTPLATAMLRGKWLAALELMRCGACPNVRVCETERAFLRALKIARESEANLVSVYWCGGSSPALSDKFIEAADGARAYEAKCAFIVVHVSLFFLIFFTRPS